QRPPDRRRRRPAADSAAVAGRAMSLGPGVELGPYSVVERIGRGGMATVYKAYHAALDRYVAIKVLPEFFAEDEEYRERFHQEAMSVARLRHPNILSVYDFGHERGIAYLVLELISGGTLADRLGTRIDIHDTVAMLKPIADALDHAHRNGVLHRDIKPSNILLHRDGTPVLADFGLAKLAASVRRLTASGIVMGTPEYMSPEQAGGDRRGGEGSAKRADQEAAVSAGGGRRRRQPRAHRGLPGRCGVRGSTRSGRAVRIGGGGEPGARPRAARRADARHGRPRGVPAHQVRSQSPPHPDRDDHGAEQRLRPRHGARAARR